MFPNQCLPRVRASWVEDLTPRLTLICWF